ncbi:DUF4166 domain-containing protein [Rhodoferax sp.]|uniref:DUF4166 domain-containing protein n=1 Tax=Rhodoferax sp. TaxID=50421 RepID=UPI002ACDAF00|nr:DUF4166 domain-containing protein [Rhodoferax sp.]MDZ7918980.1 DUF4166 domain-containing protein [Rhodoferax sp.]MDZ7937627.1 DUF4166 domain-containing protein [Rhodoferax sp.]
MFVLPALQNSRLGRLIYRADAEAKPDLDLPTMVGADGWSRLPLAVQRRFAVAHADTTYEGHMDLRRSRMGWVYAVLSRIVGGPLTTLNCFGVPIKVRVTGNGQGGVVWERCFLAETAKTSGQECVVRSTKVLDTDGSLLERTDGGLSMSLAVFEEDGMLVFRSHRFWWMFGQLRIRIPTLLTPGTCRVVHADLGNGLFRFTLSMVHPLWGETFYQSGVFVDPCNA